MSFRQMLTLCDVNFIVFIITNLNFILQQAKVHHGSHTFGQSNTEIEITSGGEKSVFTPSPLPHRGKN